MKRKEVSFILPNNSKIDLNYEDVEVYCKNICLSEENSKEFYLFAKDYSYFTPYFDFVMFKLNYIFINPNFSDFNGLFHLDNALYLFPMENLDYTSSFKKAKILQSKNNDLPFMTSVSDSELNIAMCSSFDTGDVLIDPYLYGMMSKSGAINGSHGVTATTVLNHLLIKSEIIGKSYLEYISDEDDLFLDPINYLVKYLGFFRATAADINPMIIGNMFVLTEEQKQFIQECLNNNYNYFDIEDKDVKSYIKEYKRTIKKGL